MYEIIYDGSMSSAVVLKDGKSVVYKGDSDEAQEYVLRQLGVSLSQDPDVFARLWSRGY